MERRLIASSLSFVAKTRLYSEIGTEPIILQSSLTMNEIMGDETSTLVSTVGSEGRTLDYVAGKVYHE